MFNMNKSETPLHDRNCDCPRHDSKSETHFHDKNCDCSTCGNKCEQRIVFPKLEFTMPGVYRYTIKELTPSKEGWYTDKRVYHVIVTVITDKEGSLVAIVDYGRCNPVFVNEYCNCKKCWCCLCKC